MIIPKCACVWNHNIVLPKYKDVGLWCSYTFNEPIIIISQEWMHCTWQTSELNNTEQGTEYSLFSLVITCLPGNCPESWGRPEGVIHSTWLAWRKIKIECFVLNVFCFNSIIKLKSSKSNCHDFWTSLYNYLFIKNKTFKKKETSEWFKWLVAK